MNETRTAQMAGKFLYGFTFVVILPLLLYEWTRLTEDIVHLPIAGSFSLGVAATLIGFAAMTAGIISLYRQGGGLPMNAYPPPRYVNRGIYRLMPHPIYIGFSLACIGISMACRSSSGLWLVSPIVALGCTALVEGFEKQDLVKRFGSPLPGTLLSLPSDEPRTPLLRERLSVYLLVLVPWLLLYESVVALGIPPDAMNAYLPFEKNLPVYEWTIVARRTTAQTAHLLPAFDEYLVGYRDRSPAIDSGDVRRALPGGGILRPIVVLDGRIVGTWRRATMKDKVVIGVDPFATLTKPEHRSIEVEAAHYGRFLGKSIVLNLNDHEHFKGTL